MTAKTLRKAAGIVRERGLATGRYEDEEGRVCAKGALRLAHGYEATPRYVEDFPGPEYLSDHEAVRRSLPLTGIGLPPGNIIVWSDQQTSAENVAAVFEAAAERLETP